MPSLILATGNHKGGVGKTATAVNLSSAFAANGQRTLLIDSDPTLRASLILGVDPRHPDHSGHTLADVYPQDGVSPEEAIVADVRPELDLLPSSPALADVERVLGGMSYREVRLKLRLAEFLEESPYDVVVIDTPPSQGNLLRNILQLVDEVMCLLNMTDAGSVQGLVDTRGLMAEMYELGGDKPPSLSVLRNFADGRNVGYKDIMETLPEICSRIDATLLKTEIPTTVEIANAANGRQTALEVRAKPSATQLLAAQQAYRDLALELLADTRASDLTTGAAR